MKVVVNRIKKVVAISELTVLEYASIVTAVENCSYLSKETKAVAEKFKKIEEEMIEKRGII